MSVKVGPSTLADDHEASRGLLSTIGMSEASQKHDASEQTTFRCEVQ